MSPALVGVLLTLLGAGLLFVAGGVSSSRKGRTVLGKKPDDKSGYHVLLVFTGVVVVYGILILIRYREVLLQRQDELLFAFGLFLVMVGGMFAQVIVSNYRADKPLHKVSGSQLLFPMLLSPIVFYVIWASAASAPRGYFAVYCAFLNGYFWESTVSKVNPPPHLPAGR